MVLAFWLLVWEVATLLVGSSLILVSPRATFLRLFDLMGTGVFWHSVATTMVRIVVGFALAFAFGVLLGVLSGVWKMFRMVVLPGINVLNAVPFASFIVLALFAMGSARISIFVPFVMVLPIFYHNAHKGIGSACPQLLEMATVFQVPWWKQALHIYGRAMTPFILAAAQVGIGFAWKSGIAAELIGQVGGTIGGNLHIARIHLQTADVYAWTVAIVLLSYGMEKLLKGVVRWKSNSETSPKATMG